MEILEYILPPVMGAIIGYFTNMLAIQMLFRPYRKWYLWKIPIPLTPGLIPKKREDITQKIAQVGDRLFSDQDTWQRRLGNEAFRDEVYDIMKRFWDKLYNDAHPTIRDLIPDRYEIQLANVVQFAETRIQEAVHAYLLKPDSEALIQDLVRSGLDHMTQKELQGLLNPEKRDRYFDTVYSGILLSPRLSSIVDNLVQRALIRIVSSNHTLNDYITQEHREILIQALSKEFPFLLVKVSHYLDTSPLKPILIEKIKTMVHQFLDDMGTVKRFVMDNVMQVRKKVDERTPIVVEQFIHDIPSLWEDEDNRDRTIGIVRDYLNEISHQPLRQLVSNMRADVLERSIEQVGEQFTRLLQSPNIKQSLQEGLSSFYETHKETPLQEILGPQADEFKDQLAQYLSEQILTTLRSNHFTEKLNHMLHDQLHKLIYENPIGKISERIHLSEEQQEGFVKSFADFALDRAQDYIFPALQVMNVKQLLIDRMEAFSIQQVEELILIVIKRHFKYINMLGGIIGSFVGGLQVVINKLIL